MAKPKISYTTGVYDISIEDYHGGPGISRSTLIEFTKSPCHYFYKVNNKEVKEPVEIIRKINALEFGNALHTFVLEPQDFPKRYTVMPKVNRATKEGKAMYQAALEYGKPILCEEAWKEIVAMDQSIQSNSLAHDLITDAVYEKSLFWTDPETELLCKVRPDIWHENFICDLKTTVSASYKDFQRSIFSYGYHIQAAMIHEALKHVKGQNLKTFTFVAIEKEAPYAVAVYQLDELAIDLGVSQFKEILRGIRRCTDENNWPSYDNGLINLPTWAFR